MSTDYQQEESDHSSDSNPLGAIETQSHHHDRPAWVSRLGTSSFPSSVGREIAMQKNGAHSRSRTKEEIKALIASYTTNGRNSRN